MKNKEVRSAIISDSNLLEKDNNLYIEGLPIVFNEETEIQTLEGSYKEIIKPGALDQTEFIEARLLYNHDLNEIPLASIPNTMEYKITDTGLKIRAMLPNTERGKEVHTAIKRGDLKGMSFSFVVAKDGDFYDESTNVRTITKIDRVFEFSIVPFPAYPTTTIEARAKEIRQRENKKGTKEKLILDLNKLILGRYLY